MTPAGRDALAGLWARRGEPHVAPLVELADRLAAEQGLPVGTGAVPYPDPDGAGVRARVLFLLNDPGKGSLEDSGGTGMLSLINRDRTTTRQLDAISASGFDRRVALHWNGIPWPVEPGARGRAVGPAADALRDLLAVLDEHGGGRLRGVVTLGEYAQKVWARVSADGARYGHLQHVASEHPAARSAGVPARLAEVYRQAAVIAAG